MISKGKAFVITAVAVILAVVLTVVGTSFIGLRIDEKVIISTDQYDEFVELNNKYSKHEYLEKYIEKRKAKSKRFAKDFFSLNNLPFFSLLVHRSINILSILYLH